MCLGGKGVVSSSTRGDLPTIVEAFVNCTDDDLRDIDGREGVTPPTPCNEFIDTFRSRVGVEDREVWLMELGDRWRGLRGGREPFVVELFRCPKVRAGEAELDRGEAGKGVAAAVLIERRWSERDSDVWLLFVDCDGAAS